MVSAAGGSVDDEAQNDDLKVGNFVAGVGIVRCTSTLQHRSQRRT